LFPYFFKQKLTFSSLVSGYAGRLINKLRRLFSQRSFSSLIAIGLMNGLLPCGLVYVAISGAINTPDILQGAAFMALFGLGTIPMMLVVSLGGNLLSMGIRNKLRRVVPFFIVLLGLLFILRGMSLGIPYVSPKSEKLEVHQTVENEGSCPHCN